MDIDELNDESYDNEHSREFPYDPQDCLISIFLCPPTFDCPIENFAFVVYTPSLDGTDGSLKAYNLTKGTFARGYMLDREKLKKKYIALRNLVVKNKNAKLIWEGKIHGLTERGCSN